MVQHTLLLTTLAVLTATAGCIGGDGSVALPADRVATEHAADDDSATAATQASEATMSPGCAPHGSNNYGIMHNVGPYQLYIEGTHFHVYEESNGIQGIQTEAACPENPDTKYVDLTF